MRMSLKPRHIDFQETWANLKETVAGVVALRAVERGVWNMRFSDVYALCVAHPEPLADRLYEETRCFLEEHVSELLERVRGNDVLTSSDYRDGLLGRYCLAWSEYSQGVAYLNSLYLYLNLQHIKRQKISDAEIIYGTTTPAGNVEQEARQLERRADLKRMYALLKPLGPGALKPLVEAAHAQAARDGAALLASGCPKDEAHVHFVRAMLGLHGKYSALFGAVFGGDQAFAGALDKACSEVVNSRSEPEGPCRAPELLARYCDGLLRKRAGAGGEAEVEERLAAAIVVFKYVDDKDVFQKYYARTLARRLIHQLSASMEQEEAMIDRLKAACGYEFTNKLHRMFTDIAVSADLNAKFQKHLREREETLGVGFFIQVLQAGAWPLGGAMAPLSPPAQLERPARLFESFYRSSFSGRRLAWLHHLCTGELRTRYTHRLYHVSATTPQCALLLCFQSEDRASARDLREALQLTQEAWLRHARPIVESGLLLADGELEEDSGVTLTLNLGFQCKRSRVKVTCAGVGPAGGGGGPAGGEAGSAGGAAGQGGEPPAHCDDDRKMYLQAALVRIMKQRKVLRHNELIQEVVSQARGSFAPSVAMIKKCIEALIDKQYLERAPGRLDTYSYLA